MKKTIATLISILLACCLMLLPASTLAVDVLSPACQNSQNGTPAVCSDNQSGGTNNPIFGPNGLATTAVQILTVIVGIASVIVIIISGIRFITAGGNPENIAKARKGLTYAVVGLLITLVAQSIVTFILHKV